MSFPKVNIMQLVAAVRRLAEEYHNFVYVAVDVENSVPCKYVSGGDAAYSNCGCIIGQALLQLSHEVGGDDLKSEMYAALENADNHSNGYRVSSLIVPIPQDEIRQHLIPLVFVSDKSLNATIRIINWLADVQAQQDRQQAWQTAVRIADAGAAAFNDSKIVHYVPDTRVRMAKVLRESAV